MQFKLIYFLDFDVRLGKEKKIIEWKSHLDKQNRKVLVSWPWALS